MDFLDRLDSRTGPVAERGLELALSHRTHRGSQDLRSQCSARSHHGPAQVRVCSLLVEGSRGEAACHGGLGMGSHPATPRCPAKTLLRVCDASRHV